MRSRRRQVTEVMGGGEPRTRRPPVRKAKGGHLGVPRRATQRRSETKGWAEGDAEIVVRAVVEIDFVADIETKADGAEMSL